MRKRSDLEMEQQIFLGGQCSNKHEEYMFLSRMTPEDGLVYWILKDLDAIMKLKDKELVLNIMEKIGVTTGWGNMTELTKLSAILGDTRKKRSIGKDWKTKAKRE